MCSEDQPLTVYFDGSCPLCQAEIGLYRQQDATGALRFLDVSRCGGTLGPDLTKQQAMKRFYVRRRDGTLLSGSAAFVALWFVLPQWHWVARVVTLPGIGTLLEAAYRLFLPMRPILSRLFGRVRNWR